MSRWTTADLPDLRGRTALVTGANAGLGKEVARGLSAAGATVVLGCRNVAKAEQAAAELRSAGSGGPIEILELDLADLASVRAAAARFVAGGRPLDLLVNNAGLMALDQSQTADGFEMQFGVNHLGHFALTAELLPALAAAPAARVVTVSSMGHRMGKMAFDDLMHASDYDRWTPYFQSKLANLLFTSELQRRLTAAGHHTVAVAAHPGASHTDLGTEGQGFTNRFLKVFVPFTTQSAARGAEPILRAAVDPAVVGGEYFGPRWLMRGHAVPETPSRRARSQADAERLWSMSEELIGQKVLSPAAR
jgi:protochlorophyllide reductase